MVFYLLKYFYNTTTCINVLCLLKSVSIRNTSGILLTYLLDNQLPYDNHYTGSFTTTITTS